MLLGLLSLLQCLRNTLKGHVSAHSFRPSLYSWGNAVSSDVDHHKCDGVRGGVARLTAARTQRERYTIPSEV